MARTAFKIGDPAVFRKQKTSEDPGPRARDIRPSKAGEDYTYFLDKLWVVEDILADGRLLVATRRGKRHLVDPDDPHLRRPNILERLRFGSRFPKLEDLPPRGEGEQVDGEQIDGEQRAG